MSIVQGDNGYAIPFIAKKDTILDLTGASVEVAIERNGEIINKPANIIDPLTGKCEVILSSSDLSFMGTYTYQWTAYLPDGKVFSGNPASFYVKDKISDFPQGEVENTVIYPFATTMELDTVQTEITNAKETFPTLKEKLDSMVINAGGHTHSNKTVLDALSDNAGTLEYNGQPIQGGGGSTVTDSATNGNITVDGETEIQVYDDAQIKQEIAAKADASHTHADLHTHTNKTVLDQVQEPYTTTEKTKLAGIDAGAQVNAVTSVNGLTGDVIVEAADGGTTINDLSTTSTTQTWSANKINTELSGKASTSHTHSDLHTHANKTILDQITAAFTTELKTKLEALNGILVYATVEDLQTAYPNGTDQPVWITSDKSWYYWDEPVADTTAPTLSITSGGTFTGTKTISMSTNETATIYYTLDGSTPTTASTVYTGSFSISDTTTLKAFAVDSAGNQSAIQTVTYTLDETAPADTTAPENVTNLQASNVAETSLTLTWTASTSSDADSYDVYNGDALLGNTSGTNYDVSGLIASTQYTFTVKAKDTSGNAASGASVTATTAAEVVEQPPTEVTTFYHIDQTSTIKNSGSNQWKGHRFDVINTKTIEEFAVRDSITNPGKLEIWELWSLSGNQIGTKLVSGSLALVAADADRWVSETLSTPYTLQAGQSYLIAVKYGLVGAEYIDEADGGIVGTSEDITVLSYTLPSGSAPANGVNLSDTAWAYNYRFKLS